MTEWTTLLWAAGLGVLSGYIGWGNRSWLRAWEKQRVRRKERVRFASDVNTRLHGYQPQRNPFNLLFWGGTLSFVLLGKAVMFYCFIGTFLYLGYLVRYFFLLQEERLLQSVLLTERGVHLLPAQGQLPVWKRAKPRFLDWRDVEGYRIDGGYVIFYKGDQALLHVEFGVHDYEEVRRVLLDLGVERLELTDRIWVAQLDEANFYRLEDQFCEIGWEVLEEFDNELERLNLRPEFGVMRNVRGDRLMEEHSRSWLHLNLFDVESEERVIYSSFPLWHSHGNVGYVNGLVEQEVIDHLQRWIKGTLLEVERVREREGVVS